MTTASPEEGLALGAGCQATIYPALRPHVLKNPPTRKMRKQARKRGKDEDDRFRRFRISNEHSRTKGRVSRQDGRLNISLHDTSNAGYLAKALGTAAHKMVPLARTSEEEKREEEAEPPASPGRQKPDVRPTAPVGPPLPPPPRLNIVIMVIGSRGDAQPFLKIARILHAQYGHRVRIATHPAFCTFVQEDCPGIEFFTVGGDPSELMVCHASLCLLPTSIAPRY
ncbi:glycosyltransferase family 1 protein [Thermothelomyces thermophilus ATCC 42464]|uniref:Glycosyltransferase family 1 protein n=1 Tax=Thermothelomyces thermophilus (strain ATCC 42464 / BCRC 31852 / DSM 1799) TaxID=573729 RepID=G2QBT8_THET4|nr:glycosyltransferase family 1 protein [Thermothelomyces thermophilus ATCC 42464]AEO58021.1 glycosyltransferase family 1 protein [Thermothelomyces thermophilus ATCC 42464]